ncbi:glucosyltransferase domain-containing protein [Pseudomonas silvicola]|nr:glucosyltransferase domain-containing protein [Pseudomonas silvicola]
MGSIHPNANDPEPILGIVRARRLVQALTAQPLTARQVLVFYLLALGLYALPLILNNVLFIDDNLREMQAATWWRTEGRVLGDYLFNVVSFTPGTPDFFPLSMLLAIGCMAVALTHLAHHWFKRPLFSQCLILLPLWYNPFFLQELSYQYECLTLSLGVALVILAMSLEMRRGWLQVLARAVLLAAALSLDQLPLNVYVGLVCVDVLRQGTVAPTWRGLLKVPSNALATLLLGGMLYYLSAYQLLTDDRGGVILPNLGQWQARIALLAAHVGLFITPANGLIFAGLAGCALAGWLITVRVALRSPVGAGLKVGYLCLTCAATAGVVLAVGGLLLFLFDMAANAEARVLVGVAPLLVALLLLAHRFIQALRPGWTLLLVLPLATFLSFAYVYGQYMRQKNELELFVRTLVVADLFNHEALASAKGIYVMEDSNNDINNVFARVCVQRMLPALRYIAVNDYQFLPEQLTKWGVANMAGDAPAQVPDLGEPLVKRPFYALYRAGEYGYIRFTARQLGLPCPSLR